MKPPRASAAGLPGRADLPSPPGSESTLTADASGQPCAEPSGHDAILSPASYAVLTVPDFPLHALLRWEPALAGRPVVLVAGEGRQAVVTHATAATGIGPGLAATLALARCPGAVLRPRLPAAETEAGRLLQAAAFGLSPRVEIDFGGSCTVDLQGADPGRTEAAMRLACAELARLGLPARAGAGPTPLLAAYAARQADPVLVVRERTGFLRDLPLALAEPSPTEAEILHGWGIRTLGELTRLPKAEVGLRLGTGGAALWERAAGEATRVLRLSEPPRTFAAEWDYEPPVETLEPLVFKLRRHAERLALELRAAGLVAEALTLTLHLEDGTDHRRRFPLAEPGTDVDTWLRVALSHLGSLTLGSRLARAWLLATPVRPVVRQDGLFETGLHDPHAFWENLARVAALLGEDRVGTPVPGDTWRPDTFTLEKPAAAIAPPAPAPVHPARGGTLRRYRPPRRVFVELAAGQPCALAGALTGAVRPVGGPWRVSGDWWHPGGWAVETWQVELESGGVYQLARTDAGWAVEGVVD
jgi:protein ImuB